MRSNRIEAKIITCGFGSDRIGVNTVLLDARSGGSLRAPNEQHLHRSGRPSARLLRRRLYRSVAEARHGPSPARCDGQFPALVSVGAAAVASLSGRKT